MIRKSTIAAKNICRLRHSCNAALNLTLIFKKKYSKHTINIYERYNFRNSCIYNTVRTIANNCLPKANNTPNKMYNSSKDIYLSDIRFKMLKNLTSQLCNGFHTIVDNVNTFTIYGVFTHMQHQLTLSKHVETGALVSNITRNM